MNKEKTDFLYNKFPKLYASHTEPVTKSLMSFGFDCHDGWFGIIYTLSETIQNLCDSVYYNNGKEISSGIQAVVFQCKEKFAGLRYYVDIIQTAEKLENEAFTEQIKNEISGAITMAENLSFTICELCGCPGNPRKNSWVRTLCEPCCDKTGANKEIFEP